MLPSPMKAWPKELSSLKILGLDQRGVDALCKRKKLEIMIIYSTAEIRGRWNQVWKGLIGLLMGYLTNESESVMMFGALTSIIRITPPSSWNFSWKTGWCRNWIGVGQTSGPYEVCRTPRRYAPNEYFFRCSCSLINHVTPSRVNGAIT